MAGKVFSIVIARPLQDSEAVKRGLPLRMAPDYDDLQWFEPIELSAAARLLGGLGGEE